MGVSLPEKHDGHAHDHEPGHAMELDHGPCPWECPWCFPRRKGAIHHVVLRPVPSVKATQTFLPLDQINVQSEPGPARTIEFIHYFMFVRVSEVFGAHQAYWRDDTEHREACSGSRSFDVSTFFSSLQKTFSWMPTITSKVDQVHFCCSQIRAVVGELGLLQRNDSFIPLVDDLVRGNRSTW